MKTKIVVTASPASRSKAKLRQFIVVGADVFRLNFSHGNYIEFEQTIHTILELNRELNTHIPILANLAGPKIRIGNLPGGHMTTKKGDRLIFTKKRDETDDEKIFINYTDFPSNIKPDDAILPDDGKLILRIESTNKIDEAVAHVEIGGMLFSRKGVI